MTAENIQDKIQKLELETIKAVTELQKDVQSLTKEVSKLAQAVQRMTENYVTIIQYNDDFKELRSELAHAKRIGVVKQILIGLISSVITALSIYAITQNFK